MSIGPKVLPHFTKDNTDRNRTSPFAFTGNKFEFRMPGSSLSLSGPNVILNTAVAESLAGFCKVLEGLTGSELDLAIHKLLKDTFTDHARIIFNGNGYTDEWLAEAKKRGLPNLKSTPEALPHLIAEKNIELFTKHHVLTKEELFSRYEILLEDYAKTIHIEAKTMEEMVQKDFLPSLFSYVNDLACTGSTKKELVPGITTKAEEKLITKLSGLADTISDELDILKDMIGTAEGMDDYLKAGTYYHDTILAEMETIRLAVNEGADVIVCVGYLYGASLAWAAEQYPNVKFIAVDVTQGDIGTDEIPSNCYCITFKEEQAGYLAGYAIAKDGKTKLGFLGGMAVPAVIRYGYGFVQGADAAAQELGQNIDINYFYGGQFYGDANITSRMEGWYSNGTQVVFACGGGIYTSAVEAALKNNGYVIGVDVDQNYIGANGVADGTYAYNPFITSAMKGLSEAVSTSLSDIEAGEWSTIAATNGNFGLEDGDYIGLPTDEDSWNFETFTVEEYEELKQKIASGEIVVDNSSDDATKPTVSEFTNVTYIQ